MDINALLQMLGLTGGGQAPGGVTGGMALGQGAGRGVFQPPQQDYSRVQKLLQYLRQAQTAPQFDAAKAAMGGTIQDVKNMAGRGLNLGGSALGALNLAPIPMDVINQLMQQMQGPQG